MKADIVYELKRTLPDETIVQIRIWRLPEKTAERPHGFKYSLFYGRPGERIVGYDNERGKGDHRHYRDREEPYHFRSLDGLITDFENDIRLERGDD